MERDILNCTSFFRVYFLMFFSIILFCSNAIAGGTSLVEVPGNLNRFCEIIQPAENESPSFTPQTHTRRNCQQLFVNDTSSVKAVRYEPLTAKDSATYQLIDSLERTYYQNKLINLQKNLIKGQLSMGPFSIDPKHLVGYNTYEGLKLGLGLWTNESLTGRLSVGGYYERSFAAKKNNFGTGIKWKPKTGYQTVISASYNKDMFPTGELSFLRENPMSPENLLKSLFSSVTDRQQKSEISIQSGLGGNVLARLHLSHSEVIPFRKYPFIADATGPLNAFTNTEYGLKTRWSPLKSDTTNTEGGSFLSQPPKFWFNIALGAQEHKSAISRYSKVAFQTENTFQTGASAQTTLRLSGGIIKGDITPANLYSFFGIFENLSIEIPFMFATMSPNEFAADHFAMAFLNHSIPLRQESDAIFKPEINLMTRAAVGDILAGNSSGINTFNKGFFESGILFDNLLNIVFVKYGIAVHYRYGPYQKKEGIDNWSFRLAVDFAL